MCVFERERERERERESVRENEREKNIFIAISQRYLGDLDCMHFFHRRIHIYVTVILQ